MKLFEKIKKWYEKYEKWYEEYEKCCEGNSERDNSVECPYCDIYYSLNKIREIEQITDTRNFTTIKCLNCYSIFGVKVNCSSEEILPIWRITVKLWKNNKKE